MLNVIFEPSTRATLVLQNRVNAPLFFKPSAWQNIPQFDAQGYSGFVKQVPTDNILDTSVCRKLSVIPDGSKVPAGGILQDLQDAVGTPFPQEGEDFKFFVLERATTLQA